MIKIVYRINEMREKKQISRNELARRTGLPLNSVSMACSSKELASPKLSTLAKYAEALECQVNDLFTETKIEENVVN